MRSLFGLPFLLLGLAPGLVGAQEVIRQDENLGAHRPEAWAMNTAAASSLMTAFGVGPALAPGHWAVAGDLGSIPHFDDTERRVGFNGVKLEDLNKSPVVGRLRFALGLPAGWVAELGWSPPVSIDGARPRGLFAAAIGHRLVERGAFSLWLRGVGQHGDVIGDITCPEELAGVEDPQANPYGCEAPSDDRVSLNYYGADITAGWRSGAWQWHAGFGAVRSELQVQVDALTYGLRDRSRLVANGVLRNATLGLRRDFGPHWSAGAEVLYVPLQVRRQAGAELESDPMTSFRLQLRFVAD